MTEPQTPEVDPSPTAPSPTAADERLVITSEELQTSDIDGRVQQMRAATAPQMVRAIGNEPSQVRTRSVALVMLLAGLVTVDLTRANGARPHLPDDPAARNSN